MPPTSGFRAALRSATSSWDSQKCRPMSDFGAWPALLGIAAAGRRGGPLVLGLQSGLRRESAGIAGGPRCGAVAPVDGAGAGDAELRTRTSRRRREFPPRCARVVLSRRRQSRRRGRKPLRARLRPARSLAAAGAAVLSGLSRRHESGRAGGRCLFIPGRLGIHVAVVLGAGDGEPSRAGKRPRGLRLSRHGELRHAGAAAGVRPAGWARRRLRLRVDARASSGFGHRRLGAAAGACRSGLESGPRAAARLAAAGASGGAEPCLGADERSDDQGRHLRLHPHRVRSGRRAGVVVEPDRAGIGGRHRGDRHALRADAERSEASAGLFHRRERRHHLYRPWPGAGVPRQRHGVCRRRSR